MNSLSPPSTSTADASPPLSGDIFRRGTSSTGTCNLALSKRCVVLAHKCLRVGGVRVVNAIALTHANVGSTSGAVPTFLLARFRWPPARTRRAHYCAPGSPRIRLVRVLLVAGSTVSGFLFPGTCSARCALSLG
jgi:hypothetical protein